MMIRKAKPEDYKKIANLRKKTFEKINSKGHTKTQVETMNRENPPKLILEKMKKRDMFCLIDKEKILGVIDLEDNKIGGFFIRYNHIKKGLGKKLLDFIENYAKKKGLKKLKLYSTKYAVSFYSKNGYKLIKKGKWRPGSVSFTTYKMEKKIK